MKTRLEILCEAHKIQGGTIFQFNRVYNVDFLSLTQSQFETLMESIKSMDLNETRKLL